MQDDLAPPRAGASLFTACRQALAVGTRVPAFSGMAADRSFHSAEGQYGRPAVILLAPSLAGNLLRPILAELCRLARDAAFHDADLLILTDDDPAWLGSLGQMPENARLIDCGAFISRRGAGGCECAVLLADRNQRIAHAWRPGDLASLTPALLAGLSRLPREAPSVSALPTPALVLPNLLPPELCMHLIETFERAPAEEGRVARTDASGVIANVVDHARKSRRDVVLDDRGPLHAELRSLLLSRCRGEIAKAFRGEVTQADRIVLARYDAGAGWFRRHRDDQGLNVAFREFALSIPLNDGYAGGGLLFPEYSDTMIAPPAGAGLIFSASILHEVTPVTQGRRYALLTFLYREPVR